MRAHVRLARSLQTLSGAALAAVLTAALAAGVGIRWNTRTAGGSDSYGYVSQAYVWLDGGPPISEPLAQELRRLRVRDAAWVASPLGYRPGRHAGELAPTYPPGLPLLMAGAIAVFGAAGAFLISPLAGALAVWSTFALGRRVATPAVAASAAALLATNPTFLFQLVQPMSDVPVTALWTACLVVACGTRLRDWWYAGILAAVAITVRPNLAPLTGIAALVSLSAAVHERRFTPRQAAAAVCAIGVPALGALAWLLSMNRRLFGSATASGYGSVDQLFSLGNVPLNAARYGRAVLETNPLVAPLAVAAAVALVARGAAKRPSPLVAVLAGWCAAVLALYLPYLSFPEWWYTRFLLPAYPVALVLALAVIARAAAVWRFPRSVQALVIACALVAGAWIAYDRGVLDLERLDARYKDVGLRVDRLLPRSAVVFAMQHSGTIRFYGHRPTLRPDLLRPQDLDRVVQRLAANGRPCFAVLDPHESERYLTRFAGTRTRFATLFVTPAGVHVMALTPAARTR